MPQKWELKIFNSTKHKVSRSSPQKPKIIEVEVKNKKEAIERAQIEIIKGYHRYWEELKLEKEAWAEDQYRGVPLKKYSKKRKRDFWIISNPVYCSTCVEKTETSRGRVIENRIQKISKFATEIEAKTAIVERIMELMPEAFELKVKYKKELEDCSYEWIDAAIIDAPLHVKKNGDFSLGVGVALEIDESRGEDKVYGKMIEKSDTSSEGDEDGDEEYDEVYGDQSESEPDAEEEMTEESSEEEEIDYSDSSSE